MRLGFTLFVLLFLLTIGLAKMSESEAHQLDLLPCSSAAMDREDVARRNTGPSLARSITKRPMRTMPKLKAAVPLYGMFLFDEQTQVWAVLDKSTARAVDYDVLYLDLDADSDLTEAGERFTTGEQPQWARDERMSVFRIGDFTHPGTDKVHTGFEVTWTPNRVYYSIKWNGLNEVFGAMSPESYLTFSTNPEKAPVLVPDCDRPLHFMSTDATVVLYRTRDQDLNLMVGIPGDGESTFSCVDDEFLPKGEPLVASLIYKDRSGKEQVHRTKLRERC